MGGSKTPRQTASNGSLRPWAKLSVPQRAPRWVGHVVHIWVIPKGPFPRARRVQGGPLCAQAQSGARGCGSAESLPPWASKVVDGAPPGPAARLK
jgi:hypothetical protein